MRVCSLSLTWNKSMISNIRYKHKLHQSLTFCLDSIVPVNHFLKHAKIISVMIVIEITTNKANIEISIKCHIILTYKDIADSLAQAQADPRVKNISMRIDSPGGNFDGKEVKMYLNVGDKVITNKYAGTEVKFDGEEYTILRQDDILAIVE